MCICTRTLKGYIEGTIAMAMAGVILLFVFVFGIVVFVGMVVRATYDMAVLNWALRKGRA